MAKWPKVPALSGWLQLSRRGQWLLRGEEVRNPASRAFIAANYGADTSGRYFFQNGPQRVYVALERTPWIYRLDGVGGLTTHTGLTLESPTAAYCDEQGDLYLRCELGLGLVDDRDLSLLALAQRDGATWASYGGWCLPVAELLRAELPGRFGFVTEPHPDRAPA